MSSLDFFLVVGLVGALVQLLVLFQFIFREKKLRSEVLTLIATCQALIGLILYFNFGIPLDEGTLLNAEVPAYELRFFISAGLLIVGMVYPLFRVLKAVLRFGRV